MGYDDKDFENQLEKELDEFMGQQYGPVSDDPSSEYFSADDVEDYEDDDIVDEKKQYKKRILVALSIVVAAVLLCVGVVFAGFAYYYSDKFVDGTVINGTDCSKLTVKQAEKLISDQVSTYSLTVSFLNNQTETIKGTDINYEFVSDGSVQKIKDGQSGFAWVKGALGEKNTYTVETNIKFSDAMLEHLLSEMTELQDDSMVASSDATIEYVDNKFTIIPEVVGNKLDKNKLHEAVKTAITNGETSISAEEQGVYDPPSVLSDDATLNAEVTQLNNLLGASITYQLPNAETQVLDGQVMIDWLKKSDDGQYTKDDKLWKEKIVDYVAALAKKVDTYGLETVFDASEIGDTKVKGDYGFQIDQTAEVEQLTEELANKTITTRKPNFTHEALSYENNGFGKSYIEIDLSRQRLWFYLDGNKVLDTNIVSGLMTEDRYTPAGIFTLTFKKSPSVLRGAKRANGTYEYEANVNYWMPFNGGIGMHDSTWRSSSDYGGDTYIYSGSHGCINMQLSAAKTVYESITKDMPIICYYSQEYTLRASTASASSSSTDTATTDDGPAASESGSSNSSGSGSSSGTNNDSYSDNSSNNNSSNNNSSNNNSSNDSGSDDNYTEPTQAPTAAPTAPPTEAPTAAPPETTTPQEPSSGSNSSSSETPAA